MVEKKKDKQHTVHTEMNKTITSSTPERPHENKITKAVKAAYNTASQLTAELQAKMRGAGSEDTNYMASGPPSSIMQIQPGVLLTEPGVTGRVAKNMFVSKHRLSVSDYRKLAKQPINMTNMGMSQSVQMLIDGGERSMNEDPYRSFNVETHKDNTMLHHDTTQNT